MASLWHRDKGNHQGEDTQVHQVQSSQNSTDEHLEALLALWNTGAGAENIQFLAACLDKVFAAWLSANVGWKL